MTLLNSPWRRSVNSIAIGIVVAIAFTGGIAIGRLRITSSPSKSDIFIAQQTADKYLPPVWVALFHDKLWLRELRNRGYSYCFRSVKIDLGCAGKQDEAIHDVFFALLVSKAQQQMASKDHLTTKEAEVARNPKLRTDVLRYCTRLYLEHGGEDARVLATCLGNLSEYSSLVAVPVP